MAEVTLRRVGRDLILPIPHAYEKALGLSEGGRLSVSIANGKIVACARHAVQLRYRIEDLLMQCDVDAPVSRDDADWMLTPSVGREFEE